MGSKSIHRDKIAAAQARVWAVLAAPEAHSLMARERALDALGRLWELDRLVPDPKM